jgi:hypothetical protein
VAAPEALRDEPVPWPHPAGSPPAAESVRCMQLNPCRANACRGHAGIRNAGRQRASSAAQALDLALLQVGRCRGRYWRER